MKPTNIRSIAILSFAALICLGCFVSVPCGPVPLTIQNMLVMLASCILGGLNGAGATGIFIIAGTLGAPVFCGCHGGINHLMGPTGGFIAGYFLASIVAGLIAGTPFTFEKKFSWKNYLRIALAALAGYAVIYIPGIAWFIHVMDDTTTPYTFGQAVSTCLVPFIPADLAKFAVTIPVAAAVRPYAAKILYPPSESDDYVEKLRRDIDKQNHLEKHPDSRKSRRSR